MDDSVKMFAEVMIVIVGSVGSFCAIGLGVRWGLGANKRAELSKAREADGRLELLQQSVDSIAIEVERIAEAQRFSAKLLADRSESERIGR